MFIKDIGVRIRVKRKRGKDKTKRKSKLGRNLVIGATGLGLIGLGGLGIKKYGNLKSKNKPNPRFSDLPKKEAELDSMQYWDKLRVKSRKNEIFKDEFNDLEGSVAGINRILKIPKRKRSLKDKTNLKQYQSIKQEAARNIKSKVSKARKAGTYFSFPTSSSHLADFSEGKKVKRGGKNLIPNKVYNSPIKGKKKMILASKKVGGKTKYKLLHFGAEGYGHNYSKDARKNYLKRSAGIKNKSGELTKNDPFSPNYHARKHLWSKNTKPKGTGKFDK